MPAAAVPGAANIGELVALRMAPRRRCERRSQDGEAAATENAENRFFEALAEIRALKRAANQAGE